jgi:hypothetical protein
LLVHASVAPWHDPAATHDMPVIVAQHSSVAVQAVGPQVTPGAGAPDELPPLLLVLPPLLLVLPPLLLVDPELDDPPPPPPPPSGRWSTPPSKGPVEPELP